MPAPLTLGKTEKAVCWLLASALWTAIVGWIAFQLQQEDFAPAVLSPLLVGTAVGAGGLAILHFTRFDNRRVALVGALAWGLLVVVGQDYIGHRHRLREFDDALARQGPLESLAIGPADPLRPGFAEYLAGVVRRQPAWWSVEVLLTCGAALAVTAWGLRAKTRMSPFS